MIVNYFPIINFLYILHSLFYILHFLTSFSFLIPYSNKKPCSCRVRVFNKKYYYHLSTSSLPLLDGVGVTLTAFVSTSTILSTTLSLFTTAVVPFSLLLCSVS